MASLAKLAGIEVSAVKGLGGKRAAAMAAIGVETVADLLYHVPRRYIDRSHQEPIADLAVGSEVTVTGTVRSVSTRRPRRNLTIVEAVIYDDSASIKAVWFNQRFRVNQLAEGTQVALSGVVESFRGRKQMSSPVLDVLDSPLESLVTGRVVPIHPSTKGVTPGVLRRAIHNALTRARPIDDPVPPVLLATHGLADRATAFENIHFPDTPQDILPARARLVYDELFRLEIALALQKRKQKEDARGIAHQPTGELTGRFLTGLAYKLTGAQSRVLSQIDRDMRRDEPMHRLLQGEVGSGKTVVAVAAMLSAVEGGWQTAIMAPTEVLAEQHFLGVVDLLARAGLSPGLAGVRSELGMESLFSEEGPAVHLALLTGSFARCNYRDGITRSDLIDDIAAGQVDLVVGTHALIQEGVEFSRLGAAVVDEQHRFGVAQRVKLRDKAGESDPDLLIMTATPIPRTLAMTLYGDLDISEIDEMPPGRTPVKTVHLPRSDEERAWKVVRSETAKGNQAFVVCPLVDDSPKVEAASAKAEHARISAMMSELRVGLIHGQLPSSEKEAVMAAFRDNQLDVLVATTVIEVGVDVPNATVMVIEDANRFGLSQLHQLRGRVGRGNDPAVCILIADPTTTDGEERITAMLESNDGFELANADLVIRGQGTIFDNSQSGMSDLKVADILRDHQWLTKARRDGFALVDADPMLTKHPELAAEIRAMMGDRVDWLFKG